MVAVLLAIFGPLACGGDDEPAERAETAAATVDPAVPTAEEDMVAIERLMLGFAAATGAENCDFYSVDLLAKLGGQGDCRRKSAGYQPITITVEEITLEGDTATATVGVTGDRKLSIYPVVRDGLPTDSYDGWKLSEFRVEQVAPGEEPGEPEPPVETTTPTEEPAETTTPTEEPGETVSAARQDRLQIHMMMSDYAATGGAEACGFFSVDLLLGGGGLERCLKLLADADAENFVVRTVRVDGDKATVVVTGRYSDGLETYVLIRDDRVSDPYRGWKIHRLP